MNDKEEKIPEKPSPVEPEPEILPVNDEWSSDDLLGNTEMASNEEESEVEEMELVEAEEFEFRRFKSQFRLKSTWERIFEKYGRDFDDETDEIDLETGQIVVDRGFVKNSSEFKMASMEQEEVLDTDNLKEIYEKMKNGFDCDYYDPYAEDTEFEQKLIRNRETFNIKRHSSEELDEESVPECDYFQEFVDNTVCRQTQNLQSFFQYYEIPEQMYAPIQTVITQFRTVIPMDYFNYSNFYHEPRVRTYKYIKRTPIRSLAPYPPKTMILSNSGARRAFEVSRTRRVHNYNCYYDIDDDYQENLRPRYIMDQLPNDNIICSRDSGYGDYTNIIKQQPPTDDSGEENDDDLVITKCIEYSNPLAHCANDQNKVQKVSERKPVEEVDELVQ